ncbi:TetR/AcrR family transcriptional regulator [Microbispora sp. ATCC PTA-5024]|uniref:TetR/AcrR family transcriptional regulator n=1 Tax=Microbispora sp. ATCC PTA-5024 TaxID=316330 RepID=UPI0003DD3B01|nr:TetR/AcrR family transcriptional regulator [Microbispora sp. ATCC PTA-5024]ETK31962.1 TetR family transcriptional regulator [Microbispora sp. ATCC PTA-5024]
MGRTRAFDRDAALERALEEFWRNGYEATSIAGLTAVMGINPPSLYAAFGDKRSLFGEAVRRYQETHGAFSARALSEEPTAGRAVERLLREAARIYTDPAHPPGCLIIFAGVNTTDAGVAADLRGHREAGRRQIRRRIEEDVEAGVLPPDADAHGLATFYAAALQGMSAQARDGATRDDLDAVATLALRAWP